MEEKEKKEKKAEKKREGWSLNSILAFPAFIGIGCIAIALLLTYILKGDTNASNAINLAGQVIAYCICMFLAFFWVKSHKTIPWIVLYVVFVVTIIILFILNLVYPA